MDTIDSQKYQLPPQLGMEQPPQSLPAFFSPFLFVELVFLLIFLDDSLVGFLKVLGQDDVAVLPDSQHPSLKRQEGEEREVKL